MPKEIFQNKKRCCVRKCKLMENILYNFPQDILLQNQWKNALQIDNEVNDDLLVCAGHFNFHNFFESKYTLKEDSIPDRNLPPLETGTKKKIKHISKPLKERSFNKLKKPMTKVKSLRHSHPSTNIDERSSSPDFYGFDLSTESYHISNTVIKPEKVGIEILYLEENDCCGFDDTEMSFLNMSLLNKQKEIKCCVVKCESADEVFYKIPSVSDLQNKFSNKLQQNFVIQNNLLMCGTHFQEHNFAPIKYSSKTHTFSDRAVVKNVETNVSENHIVTSLEENRTEPMEIFVRPISPDFYGFDIKNDCIKLNTEEDNPIKIKFEFENINEKHASNDDYESESTMEEDFAAVQDVAVQTESLETFNDVKFQLSFLNSEPKYFYENLNTAAKLESWTGIKSLEVFKNVVNRINQNIESENNLCKNQYWNAIPIEESITIVLVHLKTNLNFLRMSVLLDMTQEEISYRFDIFLSILYSILNTEKNWPSKRLGKSLCLILELFEFSVETNNSNNKGNTSYKALVGFNDAGNIVCCSKVYYSTISSHFICKQEGFYDKIRRIDTVIVQKDFEIQDEFKRRGLNCYSDEKPLKANIWNIKNIIRSHIYSFEIFQKPINHQLVSYLDKILVVICFLFNEK